MVPIKHTKLAEFSKRHQSGDVEGHKKPLRGSFTRSFNLSLYIYTYIDTHICLLFYSCISLCQLLKTIALHHLLSNGDPLLALVHKWRLSEAQFLSSAFDSGWCLWLDLKSADQVGTEVLEEREYTVTICNQQKMNMGHMELTRWVDIQLFACGCFWRPLPVIHVMVSLLIPQVLPAPSCGSLSGCQSPKARKIQL